MISDHAGLDAGHAADYPCFQEQPGVTMPWQRPWL